MSQLIATSVRTGLVLDEVRLTDGVLAYQTGKVQASVEAPRAVKPHLTDAALFALAADSSNGYITLTTVGGDA